MAQMSPGGLDDLRIGPGQALTIFTVISFRYSSILLSIHRSPIHTAVYGILIRCMQPMIPSIYASSLIYTPWDSDP